MLRRICSIIICAVVAVKCSQEVYSQSWNNNPQLGQQMMSYLPPDWDRKVNLPSDINNDVINVPEPKVIDIERAYGQNQVVRQPVLTRHAGQVSNTYSAIQTVPQSYQRIVKVPSAARYIEKTHQPFIEKIYYDGNGKVGSEQQQTPQYVPVSRSVNPRHYHLGHQGVTRYQEYFNPRASNSQAAPQSQYQEWLTSDISNLPPQIATFSRPEEWTHSKTLNAPKPGPSEEWVISDN